MTLSPEQRAARAEKITASFLPDLMEGDAEAIDDKWKECIGDPAWKPRDTSRNWAMEYGAYTEPFALNWHERRTQCELTRRGEVVVHPERPFFCCTLDAYRAADRTCIDCKCIDGHNRLDDVIMHYVPQLVGQKGCTGADHVALLVVHGRAEPQEIAVKIDPAYEALVWLRVDQFWQCVETLTPPVTLQLPRLTPPEQWTTINLDNEGDRTAHNWSAEMIEHLNTWRDTHAAAAANAIARDEIKRLLPEGVGALTCAGLIVKRNRARAVSIKEAAR